MAVGPGVLLGSWVRRELPVRRGRRQGTARPSPIRLVLSTLPRSMLMLRATSLQEATRGADRSNPGRLEPGRAAHPAARQRSAAYLARGPGELGPHPPAGPPAGGGVESRALFPRAPRRRGALGAERRRPHGRAGRGGAGAGRGVGRPRERRR